MLFEAAKFTAIFLDCRNVSLSRSWEAGVEASMSPHPAVPPSPTREQNPMASRVLPLVEANEMQDSLRGSWSLHV